MLRRSRDITVCFTAPRNGSTRYEDGLALLADSEKSQSIDGYTCMCIIHRQLTLACQRLDFLLRLSEKAKLSGRRLLSYMNLAK